MTSMSDGLAIDQLDDSIRTTTLFGLAGMALNGPASTIVMRGYTNLTLPCLVYPRVDILRGVVDEFQDLHSLAFMRYSGCSLRKALYSWLSIGTVGVFGQDLFTLQVERYLGFYERASRAQIAGKLFHSRSKGFQVGED